MNTVELEKMMSMLLESGDVVSILDPLPDDLLPRATKPNVSSKKKAVGCSDAEEEYCELV